MRFTREEFDTMVSQLLYQEPICFDMLCHIAEKTLRKTVKVWCDMELCLQGRSYEEDIMQKIHLRLIETTVTYFLLRDGVTGKYNDDPEGFEDWMFRVGENIKKDFANKVRGVDFKTADIEDPMLENLPANPGDGYEEDQDRQEALKQAFDIVLSADVSVYKVLTWLARSVFMLEQDVTAIQSNELVLTAFADKTLNNMYDMLLEAAFKISWLRITEEQDAKIRAALRKKARGGVLYGEMCYRAFFMKHNGAVSGKKSISDWMNRINEMIRKKQDRGIALVPKSGRKTSASDGGKKGRGGDEASNC